MDSKLLIDAIVRQTTVLIAQLSTATGIRAPLAHVADQVFVELAKEIEAQGIGRKVVADMFGLALRGYQKKVQRLSESVTYRERSLWEAMLENLEKHGPLPRRELLERFRRDDEDSVGAVLNDLVSSGLVYATGRGDAALYGVTSETDRMRMGSDERFTTLTSLVWMSIYRQPAPRAEIVARLQFSPERTEQAIDVLLADGRVQSTEEGGLRAAQLVIPVGSALGWEAAVFDHFRAVATAIAAKVNRPKSLPGDRVGGATLSFDLRAGHPYTDRVLSLLARTRTDVNALWSEVAEHNRQHPIPDADRVKVYFYFGQHVDDEERLAPTES
jgi:chromosome segregation and condensation protein ScpB